MNTCEEIKEKFINEYANFRLSGDVSELIQTIVIPNFELFACDLDELIDEINKKNQIENESLEYIELVFNPNLYNVILTELKSYSNNDTFKHYLIFLIEYTKYKRYLEIKNKLEIIGTNGNISNSIFMDGLLNASNERLNRCKETMKNIRNDLFNNYPNYSLSKIACNALVEANNLETLL